MADHQHPRGARAGERRPLRWLVVLGVAFVAAAVAGWLVLGAGASSAGGPPPLVDALRATEWRYPKDPDTGYRRLGSPLAKATFDQVALGHDGTLAVALRVDQRVPWVVVWRDGQWNGVPFPGRRAVTALAIDPDGDAYAGFTGGGFARIASDGTVDRQPVVRSGYSVVGFAFDRDSRRGALMLSGGELHTGLRPLRAEDLNTVTMPRRARIRSHVYDRDGDLVVVGDAGAAFRSTDEGWDERSIPSSGSVRALGRASNGDLLAAQDNGHVFRSPGSTWKPMGRVPVTPVAIGDMVEHGTVVVGADGRVFATFDRDGFSEIPGYRAPSNMTVHSAVVAGHDLALAGGERWLVYDGALWDSSEALDEPTRMVSECTPVGPRSTGAEGLPPLLFACAQGRYAGIVDGRFSVLEQVDWGATTLSPSVAVEALRVASRRRASWAASIPWTADRMDHAVEWWNGDKQTWSAAYTLPEADGPLLSLSATASADAMELWTISHANTVRFARVNDPTAQLPELSPVVDHDDFVAHFGDEWSAHHARIHALGSGRAVVLYDGRDIVRVDAPSEGSDGGIAELEIGEPTTEGSRLQLARIGDITLATRAGGLFHLRADGTMQRWELPEGVSVDRFPLDSGTFDFAADGDGTVVLRAGSEERELLLRCRGKRCREVALPPYVRPRGVAVQHDRIVVWEKGGAGVGVLPLGAGEG